MSADSNTSNVHAIFFDLWETLITGVDVQRPSGRDFGEILGMDGATFLAEWRRLYEARMTGTCQDFPTALRQICRTLGHEADDSLVERLYARRLADMAKPFAAIELAILDTLERLNGSGIRLGLISNVGPEEAMGWANCALAAYIDRPIFSYEVGLAKPDPRIYLLACQRLHVRPESAIFVGDGGSNELSGAQTAGLRAYQATWFLRRWPSSRDRLTPFPKLDAPADLLGPPIWSEAALKP